VASDGKTNTAFDENRSLEVNVEERDSGYCSKLAFFFSGRKVD
jgi:hypothetical protein